MGRSLNRLVDSSTVNSGATSLMALNYGDLGRLGNRDGVSITSDDFTTANNFESYVRNPSGVDPNGYTTAATSHPDFSRAQAYDDNGNLTSIDDGAGNTRTLGYDPHNRLVAHTSTGGATTSYLYDALGRRIQTTAGSAVTRFLYSGHRVIEERDGTGAVQASYVYGRGLDEVVSMQRDVLNDTTGAFAPDGTAEDYFYPPTADLRPFATCRTTRWS